MKYGFRIVYHKDIKLNDGLIEFLENKRLMFSSARSYKSGYKPSFYRRGVFGLIINDIGICNNRDAKYAFRRLSRNRRIFGLVPLNSILIEEIKGGCMCPKHLGGQKFSSTFSDDDYITYCEIGEIKG